MSPAGGFVVAWTSEYGDGSGYGVVREALRRLGERGGERVRRQHVHHGQPDTAFGQVAHDARGNFVVTWQQRRRRQRRTARLPSASALAGARRGAEFRVNTYTTGLQMWPSVASDCGGQLRRRLAEPRPGRQRRRSLRPALRRPGARRARRRQPRQPGAGAGRDGGRAALVAEHQRRRADLQRHADRHHRPRGRHLHDHRCRRRLRHGGQRRDRAVRRLLRGLGVQPAPRALHCTGMPPRSRASCPTRRASRRSGCCTSARSFTDVPAAQRVLSLHRDAAAPRRDRRLRPDPVLPGQLDHARADGGVRAGGEGRSGLRPARLHDAGVQRRAGQQPFCRWIEELARRGGGRRMRRRQLLPDRPRSPASRWRSSSCARWTRRSTRRPAARPLFNDVPATSPFCRWIEELARRGVVTGCGGGNYCPTAAVTREQMGVFLCVTFGLTLYGL